MHIFRWKGIVPADGYERWAGNKWEDCDAEDVRMALQAGECVLMNPTRNIPPPQPVPVVSAAL